MDVMIGPAWSPFLGLRHLVRQWGRIDHKRRWKKARVRLFHHHCARMNHLYYGDNLHALRESIATESVDLIYLDPPFNSKRDYNLQ